VRNADSLRHYREYDQKIRLWAQKNGRSLNLDQVELSLLDFQDTMLVEGRKACDAERAVAATVHHVVGLSKKDMKRVAKALKGFRKRRPSHSRNPLPEDLACGIAAAGFLLNFVELGRRALIQFFLKLRPGESATIMEKDIHAPCGEPGSGLEFWSLTVAPFEDLAPSKTQTFDDCVIAREPAFMAQVLQPLRGSGRTAFVFQESGKTISRQPKLVTAPIQEENAVQYMLPHGGASRMLLLNPRASRQLQISLLRATAGK